jgi:hypothetical protein
MNKVLDTEASAFAEYTVLRQEIADRIGRQHTILTLQLTVAGALYSFALAQSGHLKFLLIVPFTTYMLFFRLAEQYYGIRDASLYIREELSPRVPGGFGWEEWRRGKSVRPGSASGRPIRVVLDGSPIIISFPVVSAAALVWAIPFTFIPHIHRPLSESIGLGVV